MGTLIYTYTFSFISQILLTLIYYRGFLFEGELAAKK